MLTAQLELFEQAVAHNDAARAVVALRRICVTARAELQRSVAALERQLVTDMGRDLCQAMQGALHVFGDWLCLDQPIEGQEDATSIANVYASHGGAAYTNPVDLLADITNTLRRPLIPVMGYATLLKEQGQVPEHALPLQQAIYATALSVFQLWETARPLTNNQDP